jgi:hypothetical protein
MVTLSNSEGDYLFKALQDMYDKHPEARVLLRKLVQQGLTHSEISLIHALQRLRGFETEVQPEVSAGRA